MNSRLTVTETVELLNQLKATVRDCAEEEEKLNRELRTKTELAEKRLKQEIASRDKELAERLNEAEAEFQATREKFKGRHKYWTARISKARHSSERLGLRRIDEAEGFGKHPLQKAVLDTRKRREEELKANEARFADFCARFRVACDRFEGLYQEMKKTHHGMKPSPPAYAGPYEDEEAMLLALDELNARIASNLQRYRKMWMPKIFGGLFRNPVATSIHAALAQGEKICVEEVDKAQQRKIAEAQRIETDTTARIEQLDQEWRTTIQAAADAREVLPKQIEQKCWRLSVKTDQLHRDKQEQLERNHNDRVERIKRDGEAAKLELNNAHKGAVEKFEDEHQAQWRQLVNTWQTKVHPAYQALSAANAAAEEDFAPWEPALWKDWKPPEGFKTAARFARLDIDVKKVCGTVPMDQRLALPGAAISVPLALRYPQEGSILFEARGDARPPIAALNAIIFRLLATTAPGKLSFTIIDPVKLGQNFSAITHLADYEENILNGRIWTEPNQIEDRLATVTEHMEKVIQMYLRNEYPTIAEYNAAAGKIAEKYHFVVIADFPANFSEAAMRRLLRIAASGARCGVFTLIHCDHRHAGAEQFADELRKNSVCINVERDQLTLAQPVVAGARIMLEAPPDAEFATDFLRRVGEASRGSGRVEVPFAQVAPPGDELWKANTTDELRVPIGRSGATKLQYLTIGKGTRQHALIAGKTGSGKSTLFHVIITNLSLWCSPEQVEFYLVDFKKGVEFKCYGATRLPHARVVAIESDREFGLSVLQRVDEELRRRGDLFRKAGVQDLAGYKKSPGSEPMPRCLLMIDEFQEFFVEDDRVAQSANVLLDRIVRQGRAFGIHVLLGSQTLGGAYTLARSTMGQMVVRIALQCNEADAYLIMDENNPAPRLLSRPGEGIYNDMAGASEGNSPFQTVWLSESERDACLRRAHSLGGEKYAGPIVFEGNAPADARENQSLRNLLHAEAIKPASVTRIWLGAPNSIKGPTEAAFQNRSGNNLLIVGQREETTVTMIGLALVALVVQHAPGSARIIVFESAPAESAERAFLERIPGITLAKPADLQEVLRDLSNSATPAYLFIQGLQNFKKLRMEDEYAISSDETSAATLFQKIITDGPSQGVHVIASVDNYNNVVRFLGRKALSEFEMRVLFQMSANDSASLCDDPKASTLGLHRALFYNEQEGHLETFRPYALPEAGWIDDTVGKLGRLIGT
ncbi:MAG TPA: FtsK/SpoIIIE domain-containing protein [Verrucomicrobiae bacterium]|nr:FtsK/SpoIIIE domain-containing protein [Verrucomicrobiae bacterium]